MVVNRTNNTIAVAMEMVKPSDTNNPIKVPSVIPTPPGIKEIAPYAIDV